MVLNLILLAKKNRKFSLLLISYYIKFALHRNDINGGDGLAFVPTIDRGRETALPCPRLSFRRYQFPIPHFLIHKTEMLSSSNSYHSAPTCPLQKSDLH